MCLLSHSGHVQLIRPLCPWGSPGENTGVGCHALLEGIFPTQGLNPHLRVSCTGSRVPYWWGHLGSHNLIMCVCVCVCLIDRNLSQRRQSVFLVGVSELDIFCLIFENPGGKEVRQALFFYFCIDFDFFPLPTSFFPFQKDDLATDQFPLFWQFLLWHSEPYTTVSLWKGDK